MFSQGTAQLITPKLERKRLSNVQYGIYGYMLSSTYLLLCSLNTFFIFCGIISFLHSYSSYQDKVHIHSLKFQYKFSFVKSYIEVFNALVFSLVDVSSSQLKQTAHWSRTLAESVSRPSILLPDTKFICRKKPAYNVSFQCVSKSMRTVSESSGDEIK